MSIDDWNIIGNIGQALEALVVLVTASFLIFEVKRWRQESGTHTIESIGWLSEFFFETDRAKELEEFLHTTPTPGIDYSEGEFVMINTRLVSILGDYDLIDFLIEKRFLSKEVVYRIGSKIMYLIYFKFQELEKIAPYTSLLQTLNEHWSNAYKLIKSGANYQVKNL